MPKVVVLDESKQVGRHAILSVGGFVADVEALLDIEARWFSVRERHGFAPGDRVKFSAKRWKDEDHRADFLAAIATMPITAVVSLLEDFRPDRVRVKSATRSDAYVQALAFEYVLQRLPSLYTTGDPGPHSVIFDHREDFGQFLANYRSGYVSGWQFPYNTVPSLRSSGFLSAPLLATDGALVEIADFVVSAVTAWASVRCAEHRGLAVRDSGLITAALCQAILPLFSVGPTGIRTGYSMVVHRAQRTGLELLTLHLEQWVNDALGV